MPARALAVAAFALIACGGSPTVDGGSGGGTGTGGGNNKDGGTDAGAMGGGAGGGSSETVIDGGYATYDLSGGNTQQGHITAAQTQPTERLALPALRVQFSDIAGSDAITSQRRDVLVEFPPAVGTYRCDGGMSPYFTFADNFTSTADAGSDRLGQWNSIRAGSSCTITITTLDMVDGGTVHGTFSGTLGSDTGVPVPDAGVTLSNGIFDVKY